MHHKRKPAEAITVGDPALGSIKNAEMRLNKGFQRFGKKNSKGCQY
jgi:hypothetical protein